MGLTALGCTTTSSSLLSTTSSTTSSRCGAAIGSFNVFIHSKKGYMTRNTSLSAFSSLNVCGRLSWRDLAEQTCSRILLSLKVSLSRPPPARRNPEALRGPSGIKTRCHSSYLILMLTFASRGFATWHNSVYQCSAGCVHVVSDSHGEKALCTLYLRMSGVVGDEVRAGT